MLVGHNLEVVRSKSASDQFSSFIENEQHFGRSPLPVECTDSVRDTRPEFPNRGRSTVGADREFDNASNQHCGISADEIRNRSTKLTELGYCDIVKVAAVDLTPDKEGGSVQIVGTAPHESLFEIKAPIETLEQVGFQIDPVAVTKDVTSAGYVDVEVPAGAIVSLVFRSFDGIVHEGRVPQGAPRGLKVVTFRQPVAGGVTVYTLQFARSQ